MNRIETLLSKLAEECNEVAQRALKAQQYGTEQRQTDQAYTNLERISGELQDLYALVEMIQSETGKGWFGIHNDEAIQSKQRRVRRYMAENRDLDALDRESREIRGSNGER